MSLGVALIGLGGVNLVFLWVSPKFMTTFPMLPNPIPYSESESLLLLQRFHFLVSHFLSTFSRLSNFLLNCVKDFFPPFLAARKTDFSISSFSKQRQSRVLYIVNAPSCFSHRSQCFSVVTFFETLGLSLPGPFAPFFLLCKGFSSRKGLDFSDPYRPHTRLIALRDRRSERISTGVPPFSWRLYWSCNV